MDIEKAQQALDTNTAHMFGVATTASLTWSEFLPMIIQGLSAFYILALSIKMIHAGCVKAHSWYVKFKNRK